MARNIKPKWKQSRREGYSLFEDDKWQKRPGFPGMHPVSRKRQSTYAQQFREKQKVKRMYGILERQFRRFFKIASKSRDNTGTRFLQLLEMRLDNVVFRLGFSPTRAGARQLVNHAHVLVNGEKIDIPSHIVSVGDSVEIKEKTVKKDFIKTNLDTTKTKKVPGWLKKGKNGGDIVSEPTRDMIDKGINERLIVEFYSKII